jgi:hypothetical protein
MGHLIGPSGIGKAQLTHLIEAIMRPFRDHDAVEYKKLTDWIRQMKTRGANKEYTKRTVPSVYTREGKRNPHVFDGRFITITRGDDGSLRPNLKKMPKLGANLSVDNYAFEVYRELRQGLKGLIEE